MAVEVDEDFALAVGSETLAARKVITVAATEHVEDRFFAQVVTFVVDFNILAQPVVVVLCIGVDLAWEHVLGVAAVVRRKH